MVELIVSCQTIEEQTSELIAVGFFQDERPLESEAGLIDSRLGGTVSSCLSRGFMTGRTGEVTLIPAVGRLKADKVLFVGLGQRAAFCYGTVRELAEQVVKTCLGLQVSDLVVAFPDPLKFGLDWTKIVEAMVEGIGLGLKREGHTRDMRLRLSRGSDYYDQIFRGAEAVKRILKNPFPITVRREPSS